MLAQFRTRLDAIEAKLLNLRGPLYAVLLVLGVAAIWGVASMRASQIEGTTTWMAPAPLNTAELTPAMRHEMELLHADFRQAQHDAQKNPQPTDALYVTRD